MFTGIVEEMGVLKAIDGTDAGARLVFGAAAVLEGTAVGDSISINGCCLTVVDVGPGWWAADAVPETLSRTNLGQLAIGEAVNLERAVTVVDRLGGHLVQGHVDGVGVVTRPGPELSVSAPEAVRRYLVEKGSVGVDGVSLTVVSVTDEGFTVALIPQTLRATTLGRRREGDLVNLEVDVMAKYAERLLEPYRSATGS